MRPDSPVVLNAIKVTKQNMKNFSQLTPVFFVGNEKKLAVVGAVFDSSANERDHVAKTVREIAREMKAEFILFVSESWTIPPEFSDDFESNRDKYPKPSDYPHKKEVVTFWLETREAMHLGSADILEGREIGEVTWLDDEFEYQGRFTHLLGPRPVKKEEVFK